MDGEWKQVKLGTIARVKGGKRLPLGSRLQALNNCHPYIRVVDISNGMIDHDSLLFVPDEVYPQISQYTVESGDVIVSIVGTIGLVAQITSELDGANLTENAAKVCIDDPNVDSAYVMYYLKAPNGQHEIKKNTVGSTQLKLPLYGIQNIEVLLPELSVQRKIAHILSSIDGKISLNRRVNDCLEEIARVIFKHWFIDFEFPNDNGEPYKSSGGEMIDSSLGPIPKGWEVRRLIELSQFIGRGIAPKYDDEGEFVIINQRCIRDKTIDFRNSRRSSKGSSKDRKLQFGDMLINSTGVGTLGRVAQLREAINNCTVDSHVTIVRPIAELDTNYFGLAMENLEPYFEDLGIGTTGQTELGRVMVGETLFLFPKENVQKEFSNTVDPLRRASQKFQQTNDVLAELRDTLLPKLMSGEIRVPVSEKENDQL